MNVHEKILKRLRSITELDINMIFALGGLQQEPFLSRDLEKYNQKSKVIPYFCRFRKGICPHTKESDGMGTKKTEDSTKTSGSRYGTV